MIAQVKRLVKKGSIPPKEVKVPGYLVDYLVVCEEQEPIYGVKDSSYIGGHYVADEQSSEPLPLTERKVIAKSIDRSKAW